VDGREGPVWLAEVGVADLELAEPEGGEAEESQNARQGLGTPVWFNLN
jgi:hypothetical protein